MPGPYPFDPANARLGGMWCRSKLPPEFARAGFGWQATSSAGFKPTPRIRLWFWLDRPVGYAEAKRWLAGACPSTPRRRGRCSRSTVADPILEAVDDPVRGRRFGVSPDRDDVVAVPELSEPVRAVAPEHSPEGHRYVSGQPRTVAEKRLEALAQTVRNAGVGSRHGALFSASCRALELDDALSRREIAAALMAAAKAAGLPDPDADLARQIKNGFAAVALGGASHG